MTPRAPRVLIADGAPASRALLEPSLRRAGWHVLAVASSFEVLRAVRDHDVSVVLIDPELPGVGVSGIDVVRTLKSGTRFRELPVFFLLRGGQGLPEGVGADGAFELDRLSDASLLETIQGALRPARGADDTLAAAREAAARAAEAAVSRYCEQEAREVVHTIVREVARDVVPAVAERLIRDEIRRLREQHGLEEPPG